MINVVKMLISIVVIALMCLFMNLINTKKTRRIRQFPLIIISFALMIVAVLIFLKYYDFIEKIIKPVSFLLHSGLAIINALLLVGFFVIKLIVRPLCTTIFKKKKTLEIFSFSIYASFFLLRLNCE